MGRKKRGRKKGSTASRSGSVGTNAASTPTAHFSDQALHRGSSSAAGTNAPSTPPALRHGCGSAAGTDAPSTLPALRHGGGSAAGANAASRPPALFSDKPLRRLAKLFEELPTSTEKKGIIEKGIDKALSELANMERIKVRDESEAVAVLKLKEVKSWNKEVSIAKEVGRKKKKKLLQLLLPHVSKITFANKQRKKFNQ